MTAAADRLFEQVLVLRCQAGDDRAFEELVRRYHDRLRYYLRRLLGQADQADDFCRRSGSRRFGTCRGWGIPALCRCGTIYMWHRLPAGKTAGTGAGRYRTDAADSDATMRP